MMVAKINQMKCPKFDKISKILTLMVDHGGRGNLVVICYLGICTTQVNTMPWILKFFKKGPQVNLVKKNISFLL
jgi:hypothetical protein